MPLRKIPKGVVALGFVSMFMDISSEMVHSLLPIFLTSVLGVSALSVGILEGIAEATANIVKIFSGAISDFIGKRKPLLLLGYGLSALTKPLFPIADNFTAVLVARFTDRIGKGIRVAPRDALMADITPADMRGAAFGLRQSMDKIGSVLGPLAAILLMLATADDFRFVFWMALIPALLVIVVIIFFIKEPDIPREKGVRNFPLKKSQLKLLNKAFWFVTSIGFILTLARFSEAFLVLRGDNIGLGPAFAPAILIAMNFAYTLSSYPAGLLSDRIGKSGLMAAGIATLILADAVLAYAHNGFLIFFGAGLWGLHMGLTQGIITAMIADEAPASLRGTAFGMFNLLSGIALLLASVIAGWMWEDIGPQATFSTGAIFAALSLLGFMAFNRRYRKKKT